MTEKEYIESFGWEPENLSKDELKAVRKELRDINNGRVVTDGVLFFKDQRPGD